MTTIDLVLMSFLCYVLGVLLGVIPDATAAYWTIAGTWYALKTALWLLLRIPLLLPIDRWIKRGMPPSDSDPALVRSIYYFPYDFSVFYGLLVFLFYFGLIGSLIYLELPVQVSTDMLLPGLLFGGAIANGAVAIGVPVNLLLTAKFSKRLSEREARSFDDIPGKRLSLQVKMATVAIALGCAPSLLLFSIQNFLQYDGLYQEASRMATNLSIRLADEEADEIGRWHLKDAHPFLIRDGRLEFKSPESPESQALSLFVNETGRLGETLTLRERRLGYVVRFTPGSDRGRGFLVKIPEPQNNYLALSLVILLACIWPFVTSLLTVKTIVKPVQVLSGIFHKIIGRGRTEGTDRVPIYYKDEVGRLAFNANRTINIITEARRQLEENSQHLAAKNRELQEAYQTKGEFLANMSHELRTPLNAIIGFSRLMKRKLKDSLPDRQRKNLDLIQQSGEQLLILVNDLLDFEKIEAGKLTIRREDVELETFFDSLQTTLEPLAHEKGLELKFETLDLPNTILSDRERLRQILTNLLTNAIKYSDSGTVALTVKGTDRDILFKVEDQGIGMTAEQIEKIFDPFHQVDGSETRERGGVGLGLAIVGRLVSLLGGKISVESRKGEGSTFLVNLPYAMSTEHLRPRGTGAPVLLVDDNIDYLESMHAELSEAGFHVRVATGGREALEILDDMRPKVILLDIVMPEMDGWELLRLIRERPRLAKTPVVITSVVKEEPDGLDLEFTGWLTKPFEFEELSELLRSTGELDLAVDGKLLIVEDDPQTAQLLQQTFEEAGVELSLVSTRRAACEALDSGLPAALILDLNLEDGSGWPVLDHLHTLEGHSKTRVFVYTASDLGEDKQKELRDSFVTLIQKHGQNSLSSLVKQIVTG